MQRQDNSVIQRLPRKLLEHPYTNKYNVAQTDECMQQVQIRLVLEKSLSQANAIRGQSGNQAKLLYS